MSLDVHNPWEAHAYFTLCFVCDECERPLDFPSELEAVSDAWCVAIARAAFEAGWFVPHPDPDGSMDVMSAWCPDCGKRQAMTQPRYGRFDKRTA